MSICQLPGVQARPLSTRTRAIVAHVSLCLPLLAIASAAQAQVQITPGTSMSGAGLEQMLQQLILTRTALQAGPGAATLQSPSVQMTAPTLQVAPQLIEAPAVQEQKKQPQTQEQVSQQVIEKVQTEIKQTAPRQPSGGKVAQEMTEKKPTELGKQAATQETVMESTKEMVATQSPEQTKRVATTASDGYGKVGSAPATVQEVALLLSAGQGDSGAQATLQIAASALDNADASGTTSTGAQQQVVGSGTGATTSGSMSGGTASETPTTPTTPTTPAAGALAAGTSATGAGVSGLSTGALAAGGLGLAIVAAAASSSNDDASSVQQALQQQQQQAAATAAQQQAFAYVTANMVTPPSSFPTTLQATYVGPVNGTLNSGAALSGTFQANVDFATISSHVPVIPGTITFANGQGSTSFNLSYLFGYVGGSMSGTYAGQNVTGYVMNGQFFGPAAQQLAGSWSMQNAGNTLSAGGTFKAAQQ